MPSNTRKWLFRVTHILDAMERIDTYTRDISQAEFESNTLISDAVLRNFEVIGEAARHVPPQITANHSEIPWSLMRGMRNVLAHDYEKVVMSVVWLTLKNDRPPLKPFLEAVLNKYSGPGDAAGD